MDDKQIVLIADDDKMLRDLAKDYFEIVFSGKYNLEIFEDGNKLDSRLKKSLDRVALVFSDNNMGSNSPSGLDILKKYSIPAILATNDLTDEVKSEVEKYGIVFFSKSYNGKLFEKAVNSALSNGKREISV